MLCEWAYLVTSPVPSPLLPSWMGAACKTWKLSWATRWAWSLGKTLKQVWSLAQFYSVVLLQSKNCVKVFFYKYTNKVFVNLFQSVLWHLPLGLTQHTCWCQCLRLQNKSQQRIELVAWPGLLQPWPVAVSSPTLGLTPSKWL